MADIGKRKDDHLVLCANEDVGFRQRGTLLDGVQLMHQALPELCADDLDMSVRLFGKTLRAPLVIAAMTGGSDAAAKVNKALSAVAEKRGYGFGLGSQRAMQKSPETAWTYQVRELAPTTLVLGNVGVVQARDTPTSELDALVKSIGADALCVHMNPAMELIQPGGDRDFRGCVQTFGRLVRELSVPVVAKETGNGLSRRACAQLREQGVKYVDVSGAGGTSWVGVETRRAEGLSRQVGEALWDWGVPTAVATAYAAESGMGVIATGGIQTGMDVARALSLGATAAGIARPLLKAHEQGGVEAVDALLERIERELLSVMLLCGARSVRDMHSAERVITGELQDWLAAGR